MLVYLKDSLVDSLPETETEMYEQFIIQTLNRDFFATYEDSSETFINNQDLIIYLKMILAFRSLIIKLRIQKF